jgi:hypothetical protein
LGFGEGQSAEQTAGQGQAERRQTDRQRSAVWFLFQLFESMSGKNRKNRIKDIEKAVYGFYFSSVINSGFWTFSQCIFGWMLTIAWHWTHKSWLWN